MKKMLLLTLLVSGAGLCAAVVTTDTAGSKTDVAVEPTKPTIAATPTPTAIFVVPEATVEDIGFGSKTTLPENKPLNATFSFTQPQVTKSSTNLNGIEKKLDSVIAMISAMNPNKAEEDASDEENVSDQEDVEVVTVKFQAAMKGIVEEALNARGFPRVELKPSFMSRLAACVNCFGKKQKSVKENVATATASLVENEDASAPKVKATSGFCAKLAGCFSAAKGCCSRAPKKEKVMLKTDDLEQQAKPAKFLRCLPNTKLVKGTVYVTASTAIFVAGAVAIKGYDWVLAQFNNAKNALVPAKPVIDVKK